MPQQELTPKGYRPQPTDTARPWAVRLQSAGAESATFTFEALRAGIFRTTFSCSSHPLPPFPSAPKPSPDPSAFSVADSGPDSKTFDSVSCSLRGNVSWSTGVPIVTLGFKDEPPLHADLPLRSYALDGSGVAHYTRYYRSSLHVGLGEKAAPLDLSNRHFTLSATDCFGYDVYRTDPMYKHIPLLIRATPEGVVGSLSTSHARGYYSVGSEMDGMWGFFKVYRQDHGGLEEYLFVGRTLQEVVKLYADLVGYPLLVPRWAFGYLAGGMKYSMLDEPRASEALMEFARKIEEHDIPCSGFQMSSGYTVAETEPKTRNVFTWNRHRFPDPKGFCDAFHKRGIRLIANIKPYVLASHPQYGNLVRAGALFIDPQTKATGIARLWSAGGGESGEGGHIDFSSKAGYEFWYNGVKELRKTGMDCMWNDNNEYVLACDDWQLAMEHSAIDEATSTCESTVTTTRGKRRDLGLWGRAIHTELMGRASHDALLEAVPSERPFVLTRSATPGTMRYACSSWSGDNITSWEGMRGANALSLNAGMCLMQCYGHDIGGFEGPQPSPELLLRWVQLGIHSPRFAINCFKTGKDNSVGDVIEPWMYPEIIPEIRAALRRRYELIPYLYSLMLYSHLEAAPPQRWVGWGYEGDGQVWSSRVLRDGETQYWLGSTLLVGGVYDPGTNEARMYLPKKTDADPGYLNTNAPCERLDAGAWHLIASEWKQSIPVLARIGGAVPVGRQEQTVAPGDGANEANLPADDWRGVEIFPAPAEHAGGEWYSEAWLEDDGISPAPAKLARFAISYSATPDEVRIKFDQDLSHFEPPWVRSGVTVILPLGDVRPVVPANSSIAVLGTKKDDRGREATQLLVAAS